MLSNYCVAAVGYCWTSDNFGRDDLLTELKKVTGGRYCPQKMNILVATEELYNEKENSTVISALDKNIPIVTPQWLEDSVQEGAFVDPRKYAFRYKEDDEEEFVSLIGKLAFNCSDKSVTMWLYANGRIEMANRYRGNPPEVDARIDGITADELKNVAKIMGVSNFVATFKGIMMSNFFKIDLFKMLIVSLCINMDVNLPRADHLLAFEEIAHLKNQSIKWKCAGKEWRDTSNDSESDRFDDSDSSDHRRSSNDDSRSSGDDSSGSSDDDSASFDDDSASLDSTGSEENR